ncbi:MAG: AzlD domain-containing protein [Peptococcaceae bacterium]|nr:AzlD domain-containing protein [Peptococcaceae bacterium]
MAKIYMIIAGMAIVTYLPRMLPMVVLNRFELPPLLVRWLRLIPPAVLAALTAQSIFVRNTGVVFSWRNIYLLAALPCFLVALKSRSLMWTVATGLISVIILNQFKPLLF